VKIPALVEIDPDFWMRRRVLVTGHTGFKGAWLSLWLQSLGAEVTGLARGVPTRPSLYELADVGAHMRERSVDVRDAAAVREAVREARPQIVLHLAAQPLVRRSLREPALTYAVNVMGTVNVLEAVREVGADALAVVVVTSDKCYENPERLGAGAHRFVEGDPLGGADPYSSSKACAELVASSYRRSFFSRERAPRLATARAGNVIGGGDWGEDRLVPDAVRALEAGTTLHIRNPRAVRPWQHVLNPLGGYLCLAEALALAREGVQQAAGAEGADADAASAWNFGPAARDARPVSWIVERLAELWAGELAWELDGGANPPEAGHLELDSSAAEARLGWRPAWTLEDALERVVEWHAACRRGDDMRDVSLAQIGQRAARIT
jgi:CDP-glucose 4,6-dehydratase